MKSSDAHNKSVLKTLEVLEQYIDNDQEKGIYELSIKTGIPTSTMQRLVNTLELKGYLIQNPKTYKYRLGLILYHLYKNFSQTFNWVDEAKQYMEDLVTKHKETINLAYLEGKYIVYFNKVDSPQILRPNFSIGTRYPAHCTALGKCLLSNLPKETIKLLFFNNQLFNLANKTNKTSSELIEELSCIREQGYAIDDEEFQEGLRCLAVPIINKEEIVIASLSVTAPSNRMSVKRLLEIKDDMIATASKITSLID